MNNYAVNLADAINVSDVVALMIYAFIRNRNKISLDKGSIAIVMECRDDTAERIIKVSREHYTPDQLRFYRKNDGQKWELI